MPAHRHVSLAQLNLLVDWMMKHPELARGTKLPASQGNQLHQKLYQELASVLNAIPSGSTKSPDEWKQYWRAQKYKIRQKGRKIQTHMSGTGGGPPCTTLLSSTEDKILSIVGVESVVGIQGVKIPLNMGFESPSVPLWTPAPTPAPAAPSYGPVAPVPAPAAPVPAPAAVSAPAAPIPAPTARVPARNATTSAPYYFEVAIEQPQDDTFEESSTEPNSAPQVQQRKAKRRKAASNVDDSLNSTESTKPQASGPKWALDLENRRIKEAEALRLLQEEHVSLLRKSIEVSTQRLAIEQQRLELEQGRAVADREFRAELMNSLRHFMNINNEPSDEVVFVSRSDEGED